MAQYVSIALPNAAQHEVRRISLGNDICTSSEIKSKDVDMIRQVIVG